MYALFLILAVLSYLTCIGVIIAGMWASFSKAGRPGWAAIVPIYNFIVMADIGDKPWWWIFVPIAGPIIILSGFATNFGKGPGYIAGLILAPYVFFPLLGFGDAEYEGQYRRH
jgi:hypothetical protein